MPEHVHPLMTEPERSCLSAALQMLKQNVAHRVSPGVRFWQPRYYDFNVWSAEKRVEKLKYLHRNPVRRGLVEKPEDWKSSSYRHYVTGVDGVRCRRLALHCWRAPGDAQSTRLSPCPAWRSAGSVYVNHNLQSACARLLSAPSLDALSAPSLPGRHRSRHGYRISLAGPPQSMCARWLAEKAALMWSFVSGQFDTTEQNAQRSSNDLRLFQPGKFRKSLQYLAIRLRQPDRGLLQLG